MAEPSIEQMRAELKAAQAAQEPSIEQMRAELKAAQTEQAPSLLDRYKTWETGLEDKLKAGALGAAKWGGLGAAPVVAGAGNAAYGLIQNAFTGDDTNLGTIKRDYLQGRDGLDAATEKAYKDHPLSYGAGATMGAVYSPITKLLGPVKALQNAGKLGTTAATALLPAEQAAAQGLGRLGSAGINMGVSAADGAVAGAVMDPGNKEGVIDPLQLDKRSENAKWGAGIGATLTGGVEGIKAGWKKGISTFLGPSEEAVDKYLAGRERIKSAPDLVTLKDTIDGQVAHLKEAVANGQLSVNEAKGHFQDLQRQVRDKTQDAGTEWAQSIPDWKDSFANAHQELENQTGAVKQGLQSVPHPRTIAPDVHQAVGTLKDQVVAESQASRNILANSNIGVATQPVVQTVDDAIKDHLIAGQEPITASGQATIARLRSLKDSLAKYPGMLSGEDAKRFVQQIDQESKYVNDAGGFSDSYSNALKDVRRSVDTQLKGYQPYEDQMKVVAEKTGLLNRANKAFGTPEKAHGAMNTIAGEGKAPQQELLQELGAHTGNDFTTPLVNYQKAQDTLKNGMGPLTANLPAQQKVKSGTFINDVAPYLKDNYIEQVLNESGLPAQQAAKQAEIQRLQETLQGAKDKAQPFSRWGPQSSQQKLQKLISTPTDRAGIEAQRELEALDQMRPKEPGEASLLQSIDDNRTLNEFTRGYTNGSRNATIWGNMGDAGGHAVQAAVPGTGMVLAPVAKGFFSAIGGYVDKKGGQMAQGLLDRYLNNPEMYNNIASGQANKKVIAPWLMLRKDD